MLEDRVLLSVIGEPDLVANWWLCNYKLLHRLKVVYQRIMLILIVLSLRGEKNNMFIIYLCLSPSSLSPCCYSDCSHVVYCIILTPLQRIPPLNCISASIQALWGDPASLFGSVRHI